MCGNCRRAALPPLELRDVTEPALLILQSLQLYGDFAPSWSKLYDSKIKDLPKRGWSKRFLQLLLLPLIQIGLLVRESFTSDKPRTSNQRRTWDVYRLTLEAVTMLHNQSGKIMILPTDAMLATGIDSSSSSCNSTHNNPLRNFSLPSTSPSTTNLPPTINPIPPKSNPTPPPPATNSSLSHVNAIAPPTMHSPSSFNSPSFKRWVATLRTPNSARLEEFVKLWEGERERDLNHDTIPVEMENIRQALGKIDELGELPNGTPDDVKLCWKEFKKCFFAINGQTMDEVFQWFRRAKSVAFVFAWIAKHQPDFVATMNNLMALKECSVQERDDPAFLEAFLRNVTAGNPSLETNEGYLSTNNIYLWHCRFYELWKLGMTSMRTLKTTDDHLHQINTELVAIAPSQSLKTTDDPSHQTNTNLVVKAPTTARYNSIHQFNQQMQPGVERLAEEKKSGKKLPEELKKKVSHLFNLTELVADLGSVAKMDILTMAEIFSTIALLSGNRRLLYLMFPGKRIVLGRPGVGLNVYASDEAREKAHKKNAEKSRQKILQEIAKERAENGWSRIHLHQNIVKQGMKVSKADLDNIDRYNAMYIDMYGSYNNGPMPFNKTMWARTNLTWMRNVGTKGYDELIAAREKKTLSLLAPDPDLQTTVNKRSNRYQSADRSSPHDFFGSNTGVIGPWFMYENGDKIKDSDLLDSNQRVSSLGIGVVRIANFKLDCVKRCHTCNHFAIAFCGKGTLTVVVLF